MSEKNRTSWKLLVALCFLASESVMFWACTLQEEEPSLKAEVKLLHESVYVYNRGDQPWSGGMVFVNERSQENQKLFGSVNPGGFAQLPFREFRQGHGVKPPQTVWVEVEGYAPAKFEFGGEQYYVFSLGKHSIDGNEIEFTFPSPPPTKTLYLFNYQWKQKELYEKARLVVNLYDKSKKLISAGESIWANMQDESIRLGHVTFGSIAIKGISQDNIHDVAYFSIYLQEPPGEDLTPLDVKRPEVSFARQVIGAIMQGKEAYISLFAGQPLSQQQRRTAEAEYEMMMKMVSSNFDIVSVLPMKPSDAARVRYSCSAPFDMTFGPRFEHSETSQGGQTTTTVTLSLPIGEVSGKWRILFPE